MSHRSFASLVAVVAVVAAVGLAGCAADGNDVTAIKSDSIATVTTDTTDTTDTAAFGWTEYGNDLQRGRLEVPIDVADPDAGSFSLYMIRHLADPTKRIGTLLVNPGGPGAGGSSLAEYAEQVYGQDLLDSFDILAWDPRGTGLTTPALDCVDDYDRYFALDSSPDTPDEQQAILSAADEFGASCEQRSGKILPFVSTEATAGDMDAIRRALGEDTITYFGFSYGSELGVTWASLYPETVRAMVIDGAADQSVGYLQQNLEQAAGFEGTFDTFLTDCSSRPDCAFYNNGDAEEAFDVLNAEADASPVAGPVGRPDITQGVLTTAVSDAMYSQYSWPDLEVALDDLQNGDGAGILALYDDYYSRQPDGTYDNSLEAYFAINCLDDPGTKDPQVLFDMQDEFAAVAPRLGAGWILELQFCAAWPVPAAPPVRVDAAGAGPVVVVGTTGDPATPLISTRNMANALEDGHLIIVTADQHTGYGLNSCVNQAVDQYLVDLVVPDDGLECT
ncbi:MAG: alpha/beta hydrolase [Ilumatobacteraceae bacterium]